MRSTVQRKKQEGFSLLELMVAMVVMLIVMGAIFSQSASVLQASNTTYEMTDAQQNLRTAQEFINRDLVSTGDGLRGVNNIRLPLGFVQNYITTQPVINPADPNFITLPIVTSNDDVAGTTVVTGAVPAATVLAGTDRITILMIDSAFAPISLPSTGIDATGSNVVLTSQQFTDNNFQIGSIYFVNSEYGSTFGAITGFAGVGGASPNLVFANGDPYGMNLTGNGGSIRFVSRGATNQPVPTSLMRMHMVQYFINANRVLCRRVFGSITPNGFTDGIIAENVTNLQVRYYLNGTAQPVTQLATAQDQVAVREVEISVTAQTAHDVVNGTKQSISATTSTSVRNLQFRQAL